MLKLGKAPHSALVGGYDLLGEFADYDLVRNGTFDSDTEWVKGTGWTISGGVATRTTPAVASNLQQTDVFTTTGQKFRTTFTISSYSAGTLRFYVGAGGVGTARSANGTYIEDIFHSGDSAIYIVADAAFDGSVDNIICRKLYTPDYSGRANHGTVVDAVATPWGYLFNGTSAYIEITNDIPINGKASRTLLARVKPDKTDFTTEGYIFSMGSGGANTHYAFAARGNPGTWQITDGTSWFDTGKAISIVSPQEIAVVHNNSNDITSIFVDDVLVYTRTFASLNTGAGADNPFFWGKYLGGASGYFSGTIEKSSILTQALTRRERQEEMRGFESSLKLAA